MKSRNCMIMKILSQSCYYVYIVTDDDKSHLYTGVTSNLLSRLQQHEREARKHRLQDAGQFLVYCEQYSDMLQAIAREKEIKRWSRKKKVGLINKSNPGWQFMNEAVYTSSGSLHTTQTPT